jgi:hypothetical protein
MSDGADDSIDLEGASGEPLQPVASEARNAMAARGSEQARVRTGIPLRAKN